MIVEKKGRPFAVVISPEDFEQFQELAREQFFETVREIQQANKDADPEQVLADVTEAVEAVRQEVEFPRFHGSSALSVKERRSAANTPPDTCKAVLTTLF